MNLTYFHSYPMQAIYKLSSNASCPNKAFMNLYSKFWNLTLILIFYPQDTSTVLSVTSTFVY